MDVAVDGDNNADLGTVWKPGDSIASQLPN